MDPDVKHKILDRPRGREMADWEPSDLSIVEVRRKFGGAGVSDEELLLRWMLSGEEIANMRAASPPSDYLSARSSLVTLLAKITGGSHDADIHVRQPGLSLLLKKGES